MFRGSDWDIVIEIATYEAALQNETGMFRMEELVSRYQKGIGLLPMEVLLHRPLGNAITMPYEMHNKIGLYDLAHEDMKGECMQRQLQIALLHLSLIHI